MPARASSPESSPTIASSSSPDGLRYAILVPPAARDDGVAETRLLIVNAQGGILRQSDIGFVDADGPSDAATLHNLPSGEGFLLLADSAVGWMDVDGSVPAVGLLAWPALRAAQRRAGFVDDDHFVFVSSAPGSPLVTFDPTSRALTTTSIETEGAAVVLIHRGGVTIGVDAPTETVEYAPSLNGDVTYRSDWPPAPLSRRLLGAYTAGGRRIWATADGEEFRNTVSLNEMPESAAPVSLTSATLVAPLEVTQEDELLTVAESTGDLAVVDHAGLTIERLGPFTGGSIERGETGYVVLTVEDGALMFRCVP